MCVLISLCFVSSMKLGSDSQCLLGKGNICQNLNVTFFFFFLPVSELGGNLKSRRGIFH